MDRHSNVMPLVGETSTAANADPAVVSFRIITPALAQALVFVMESTYVRTLPSPVIVVLAKLN